MKWAFCLLVAGCAIFASATRAEENKPADDNLETTAKNYVDAFMAGQMQTLIGHASPELKALVKDSKTLTVIRDQTIGKKATTTENQLTVTYTRLVKADSGQTFSINATVSTGGELIGLLIQPAGEAPSKFLEYKTKADARLPFDGEWAVYWGGRTVKENYHSVSEGQRFAYDLCMTKNGKTHGGNGNQNKDYYCFGQPILSPCDGLVINATEGIADNVPGNMNPAEVCGNHVVLDLGNNEYLFLAHLQKGSIKVKPGDHVKAGDPLGLCGNTGNSSEPHLHIHLQNSSNFGAGKGLPLQFQHYKADGTLTDRGEPTKGQVISNAPTK